MAHLKEIASAAGVSVRTVARILNGEPAEHRRPKAMARAARIREIAEGFGYRPSTAAKAVKTGRFNAITLLSSSDQPAYVSNDFLFGAEKALADRGMHLILARMPERDIAESGELPRVIRETMSDGLLVHAIDELSPSAAEALLRYRIPTVWVNAKRAADSIYVDDEQASFDLTMALLQGGAARVGLANRPLPSNVHYSAIDRQNGYLRACHAVGHEPLVLEVPRSSYHAAPGAAPLVDVVSPTIRALSAGGQRGALVCGDTRTAGAAVVAAERLGLRVPEQFKVGSFSPHSGNETSVRYAMAVLPESELGSRAVEMLLSRIDSPLKPLPPVALRATIVHVT